eukprot:340596-Chlamydomonas_euryale.AAC.1
MASAAHSPVTLYSFGHSPCPPVTPRALGSHSIPPVTPNTRRSRPMPRGHTSMPPGHAPRHHRPAPTVTPPFLEYCNSPWLLRAEP